MIHETDRDTNNSGWNFVCVYDGLGRRVRAIETFVTNGVAITSPASSVSTVDSWYDPQVEFLEVAVNVNSNVTVKTYGPDNSGVYGGMQGAGGLEAIYGAGYVQSLGSVQDYFGNVIGTITNSGVLWNPARFSSYGPVPGYQPLTLSLNTTVAQTVGWHGLHMDPDGNYHIGTRRYGPTEGRWLSADPFGHSASMDLYSYCGGDPVNNDDPDGRCLGQDQNAPPAIQLGVAPIMQTQVEARYSLPDGTLTPFSSEAQLLPPGSQLVNAQTVTSPTGQYFSYAFFQDQYNGPLSDPNYGATTSAPITRSDIEMNQDVQALKILGMGLLYLDGEGEFIGPKMFSAASDSTLVAEGGNGRKFRDLGRRGGGPAGRW
jgi:RHS repeat-associated protein